MNVQETVISAQNGCQKSLAALYAKFYPILKNSIAHKLAGRRDSQQVEDIAQEAMIKGFERIKDYKPTHNFGSWLGRISFNMMIDVARKKSKVHIDNIDAELGGEDDNFSLANIISSEDALPDMSIINEEIKERIAIIIKHTLTNDLQEVMKMRYVDGISYEDMAEELEIPLGTLKAKIFRAHQALKFSKLATVNA